jgi:cytoskeletal protein RodZ
MNKNTSLQTGSAHVAIIAILIVALIGTLGFIFWQNFTAKNTQTAAEASASAHDQRSKSTSDATTPSERYVTLSDWGVKFKIDSSLASTTITQAKKREQGADGRDYYVINTERSVQAAQKSCPSQFEQTSPALYRLSDKPAVDANDRTSDMMGILVNSIPVNGYYYVLVQFGSYCPEGNAQASDSGIDMAAEHESILASLRTLQQVK